MKKKNDHDEEEEEGQGEDPVEQHSLDDGEPGD